MTAEAIKELLQGICAIVAIVLLLAPVLGGACVGVVFLIIREIQQSERTTRCRKLYRRTLDDEENRIITDYLSIDFKDYENYKKYGKIEPKD